jgi:hypothetical protein
MASTITLIIPFLLVFLPAYGALLWVLSRLAG